MAATNRPGIGTQHSGAQSDDQGSNSLTATTTTHSHSRSLPAVAAFRLLSESLVQMELTEMEIIKAREASRWEAQKQIMETETELNQMMLQTQLLVAERVVSRKTKRVDDDDDGGDARKEALLLSLLQCSFIF